MVERRRPQQSMCKNLLAYLEKMKFLVTIINIIRKVLPRTKHVIEKSRLLVTIRFENNHLPFDILSQLNC